MQGDVFTDTYEQEVEKRGEAKNIVYRKETADLASQVKHELLTQRNLIQEKNAQISQSGTLTLTVGENTYAVNHLPANAETQYKLFQSERSLYIQIDLPSETSRGTRLTFPLTKSMLSNELALAA